MDFVMPGGTTTHKYQWYLSWIFEIIAIPPLSTRVLVQINNYSRTPPIGTPSNWDTPPIGTMCPGPCRFLLYYVCGTLTNWDTRYSVHGTLNLSPQKQIPSLIGTGVKICSSQRCEEALELCCFIVVDGIGLMAEANLLTCDHEGPEEATGAKQRF